MKEMMGMAFILSLSQSGMAGVEGDAYRAVAEASYKQSGLENMINNYVQKQLRYVPKELQTIVGNSYLVGKIVTERRVTYTWSF